MRVKIQNIINKWIEQNHDKLRQRLIDSITFNEDAFQDAYLTLCTQPLQDFDGNIEQLFLVTYRKKLRQEYRRGFRMVHPQQTFFDLLVDVEVGTEHTPCLAQVQRYIHRYIRDNELRTIFDLWVLQRRSRSYISKYMGIAQSTVSIREEKIKKIITEHYKTA